MPTPDFTAGQVMDSSRVLLNDRDAQEYTNTVLLPFLKIATRELREFCELSNIPVTNATDVVLSIPASTTIIGFDTVPALPTDLANIQQVWERPSGIDPYTPVTRREFLPYYLDGQENQQFLIWCWKGNAIHVLPCNQINDLKIDYIKELANVVDENSTIGIINGFSFLEYRTAALAAEYAMENKTRADDLNQNAELGLDRMTNIENKARQSIYTRRKPFRMNWKARGLW